MTPAAPDPAARRLPGVARLWARRSEVSRRTRVGSLPARLLAPRLPGEHHRARGHGRLQPVPGAVPVRAPGPVHLRAGDPEHQRRGERDQRPPGPIPGRRAGHPQEHAAPHSRELDHDRPRGGDRRNLDRDLVLGRHGHRFLPHLSRPVPGLAGAEALRARDAARGDAVPGGERGRSHPRGRARLQRRRPSPRPLRNPRNRDAAAIDRGPGADIPALLRDLLRRAQGPRAVARGVARRPVRHRDHGHRERRLPLLSGAGIERRRGGRHDRLRADRDGVVLPGQPRPDGGGGDQRAPLRAPRHGHHEARARASRSARRLPRAASGGRGGLGRFAQCPSASASRATPWSRGRPPGSGRPGGGRRP